MSEPIIYRSRIPDAIIPSNLSFHQYLLKYNPDDAPYNKVIFEDFSLPTKKLTYGGLRDAAAVAAGSLTTRLGLKTGDSVAILGANSVDWALLAHSVIWFGGICVGTNHLATQYELEHYLSLAEPSLVVVDEYCRSKVEKALKAINLYQPGRILVFGGTDPKASFPGDLLHGEPIPPLDLTGRHSHEVPACVLFSSGTTGKPKAVHLSHYNIIANLWTYRGGTPHFTNASTVEVFFPPFAHMLGLVTVVMTAAFTGHYVLIMKQFNYREWIRACAEKRSTLMKIVPTIAVAIAKDPEVSQLDLTSLQYIVCTGASLQNEIINALVKLMNGVSIIQGYGLSEGTISRLHPGRARDKSGSVGTLFPNVELRLVDDNMNDVPIGTPGEALIRAPTVFMHYRKNPKATAESFYEGWLRTGDSLSIDEDHHLWFQDRKKEMIKYKGLQVAPAELEDVLQSHEAVREAAVTATWDESQRTEIPIGYVVLEPRVSKSDRRQVLDEIQIYVDKRVSSYKRLRGGLHYIEAIPKNATGKNMRNLLPVRVEAARRVAAAAAAAATSGPSPSKL